MCEKQEAGVAPQQQDAEVGERQEESGAAYEGPDEQGFPHQQGVEAGEGQKNEAPVVADFIWLVSRRQTFQLGTGWSGFYHSTIDDVKDFRMGQFRRYILKREKVHDGLLSSSGRSIIYCCFRLWRSFRLLVEEQIRMRR